jgi:hypothetical protein
MENRQWKTGQVVHCSVVGCRLLIFHWLGDGDLRFTPAPRQGGLREMQNGQPTMKNGQAGHCPVVGCRFAILHWLDDALLWSNQLRALCFLWREISAYAAGGSAGQTGMVNENVAPQPGLFSAQIRPPCASTMERLIARPMPIPWGLVV